MVLLLIQRRRHILPRTQQYAHATTVDAGVAGEYAVGERLAEIAGEYLKKGKQVYIEGKLRTRSWEDQNGQKRYVTEIIANEMKMLGRRDEDIGSESSTPQQNQKNEASQPPATDDDDLPF